MTKYERLKQLLFHHPPTVTRVEAGCPENEAGPQPAAEPSASYPDPQPFGPEPPVDVEFDFKLHADLEGYARGVKIPAETIEKWISSGLLFPDEIKAAQKLLQVMRKNH
jgi:hypothetical protein